jgi:hypothetical protein
MASILNATTSSGLVTSADNSGSLQLATNNGTTAVTIDTSQNVGIGTASPAYKLDVATTNSIVARFARTSFTTAFIVNGSGETYFAGDSSGNTGYGADSTNGRLVLWANAAERMRIDSSGNLLVGTTSVIGAGKVSIAYIGNTQQGLIINDTTGTTAAQPIQLRSNNTVSGYFTTTGGTSAFVNTSDYRLKENVTPITNALATVQALKPVNYSWKLDGSQGQGFIAHELQEAIPYAVFGTKDAVNEDDSINPQGIDQTRIIAVLTSAIQELNAKVDAQALEIQALKGVA